MEDLLHFIGRRVLTDHKSRVRCPPGPIRPGEGPFIMVATIMRSGTHLLMDTVLNNFPRYKRYPLYVDLRRAPNERLLELLTSGGYVLKTHYPQIPYTAERASLIEALARRSRILTVRRDPRSTHRSTQAWQRVEGEADAPGGDGRQAERGMDAFAESEEAYFESVRRFHEFWDGFERLEIQFDDLTNPQSQPEIIRRIGEWIGQEPRSPMIRPYPKSAKYQIYTAKALTRLLGRRAPVINTTLNVGRTDKLLKSTELGPEPTADASASP